MNTPSHALRDTLATMHGLLRGAASPEEIGEAFGQPVERVAVYQRFVFAHIRTALEKIYTTLAGVLPQATWEALVRGYFDAFPADDYELNGTARQFPEYLASRAASGEPGLTEAHVEIAILEWQEFAVFVSEREIPTTVDRPTLNPTVEILQLSFAVGSFVRDQRAHEDGRHAEPPAFPTEPVAEIVFLLRDPRRLGHRFLVADDAALFAVKIAHEGTPVAEAAARSGLSIPDVQAILAKAATQGLIILPEA